MPEKMYKMTRVHQKTITVLEIAALVGLDKSISFLQHKHTVIL